MSDSACAALLEAREHDPFSVLGLHADGAGWRLRVFRPQAKSVAVVLANGERALLKRRSGTDLFECPTEAAIAQASATASSTRLTAFCALATERLLLSMFTMLVIPGPPSVSYFLEGGSDRAWHRSS